MSGLYQWCIHHFTTRDMAGTVVRPFANSGDGIGAWKSLITRYGNESKKLQRAEQIEHQRMLYAVRCVGYTTTPLIMLVTVCEYVHLISCTVITVK